MTWGGKRRLSDRRKACLKAGLLANPVCVFECIPPQPAVLRVDPLSADVDAPLDVPPQHPLLMLPQRLQKDSSWHANMIFPFEHNIQESTVVNHCSIGSVGARSSQGISNYLSVDQQMQRGRVEHARMYCAEQPTLNG